MDSALAGRVSTALSVVTELNFPLSGTITVASATHNPITNHGTHRPANRPAGAFPDGAALTAINSLLHTGYIAYLVPASYRANLRRLLNGAQAGWPTQGPAHAPARWRPRSCPKGKAQATQPSGRISNASTSTGPCGR
ncbi:hypothetical protein Psuf_018640 [Phytohabitans suffuscus]|uniref:Uncharacterized protein n=1 Tax=Phytohabitans suffuscus TaxID=624315 RepID=A0A6F8YF30_9ACTN|nr:hypothetical protein Psuf_018640 [Phytohabitans suffuscus]